MTDSLLYSGKAKSVFRTDDSGVLLMVFRDDITAFDGGKKDVLAEKGRLNAAVSAFLFGYLAKHGVKTHLVRVTEPGKMLVLNLRMIPLEVIVRNVAAGSIVRNYPFREGQKLDPPVVVIDYKNDTLHDPMLNDDIILALKIVDAPTLAKIRETALRINSLMRDYLAGKGITLVDFKIEFGEKDSELYLGDEISMDSMRLWDASGTSLDKDVYRSGKGDVIGRYRQVAALIVPGE